MAEPNHDDSNNDAVHEDKKKIKILMVGLDLAGKTQILYWLKLGKVIPTIPSLGYNKEEIDYKDVCLVISDVGGLKTVRALWYFYMENTKALIYVVDSTDQERMTEARDEMMKILAREEIKDSLLLIYANKQDLPNAMSTDEIADKLDLQSLENRKWHVQATSAISGNGLNEGLDWLLNQLEQGSSV